MLPRNLVKGLGDDLFLSERQSPKNMKEEEKTFFSLFVQLNNDRSYHIKTESFMSFKAFHSI